MKLNFFSKQNIYSYAQKKFQSKVEKINEFERDLESLSDDQIKQRSIELKIKIQEELKNYGLNADIDLFEDKETKLQRREKEGEILQKYLPEAFALVREASKRVNGERHFDVQLIAGMVLHEGSIAEMATGEGKTLAATLALYLNSLLGRGVHLVTVNDYLAKLGAGWMGRIYHFLGQSVSVIGHEFSFLFDPDSEIENTDARIRNFKSITRKEAYRTDITYGTNNEFGFDYLRDNMVPSKEMLTQRPFQFAIVDEVDSILIDEARTPLIISSPAEESAELYMKFATATKPLHEKIDYIVDEKMRSVSITDVGIEKIQQFFGIKNIYAPENISMVHHLEEALRAKALFKKDKDYVVKDGEIVIVDEFTGRMMPGRRYSGGLHQAIEAKENVEVKRESDTLATISFQNLFRMYTKLSGMTGTAATEAEEFYKIYQLDVVTIPPNRPNIRIDNNDRIYKTEASKFQAVVEEVKISLEKNQPVLIGTISIVKSEHLSQLLKKAGIKHQVLNAKAHEREGKTISQAGQPGNVTVATNMAGRGVDIILGGFPPEDKNKLSDWQQKHTQVLEAGGLKVIGTERHEARRIDNQLRGRSGRQGDPGESIFYVSAEDDLMRIFGGDRLHSLMNRLGLPDDQPITHKLITRSIESAQKRVEGYNFDTRKHLVEYDDVANRQRELIYRKRRKILALDCSLDQWLHEEILQMLTEEEKEKYLAKMSSIKPEIVCNIEQNVFLRSIDLLWVEHLNALDELRQGIGLRGYGQREPLVEYKQEAFRLFEKLQNAIDDQVIEILLKLEIVSQPPTQIASRKQMIMQGADNQLSGGSVANALNQSPQQESQVDKNSDVTVSVRKKSENSNHAGENNKVGRNDPCPCGSGKKYKKCHGA